MDKRDFRSSGELRRYLAIHGYPQYALSVWAESPPMGETFLFSDSLRPLLEYAIGFHTSNIRIVANSNEVGGGWRVENLDDPPEIVGATLEEATENFWSAIEEEILGKGQECQLFDRNTIDAQSLEDFLNEWAFAEEVRLAAAVHGPCSFRKTKKNPIPSLRLVVNH